MSDYPKHKPTMNPSKPDTVLSRDTYSVQVFYALSPFNGLWIPYFGCPGDPPSSWMPSTHPGYPPAASREEAYAALKTR